MAEVKRAYRLLAKRNHPDAGAGSLARFLEIQAAYEVLARSDAASTARTTGAAQASGRRPAEQGPRSAGSRRTSGESPGDPGAPPPPGTEWARRPRDAGGRPATGAGPAASTADAGHAARHSGTGHASERGRRGRNPRKATLGSTTYDEADVAADPTWGGADWYGRASGTYWTVNPKEYADPRKHGPEYLARWYAARFPESRGRLPVDHEPTAAPQEGASAASPGAAAPPTPSPAAAAPLHEAAGPRVAAAPPPWGSPGVGHTAWPRPLERLVVGALGWLPFGMLFAAAAGLPGGLIATLPLQAVGLIGMLWAPRLAWASAGGLAAVIAFAIPGVAALAALGGAVRPSGPAPVGLIVLAALAWFGGAAVASSGRLIARP
jgi:hypothetical protein